MTHKGPWSCTSRLPHHKPQRPPQLLSTCGLSPCGQNTTHHPEEPGKNTGPTKRPCGTSRSPAVITYRTSSLVSKATKPRQHRTTHLTLQSQAIRPAGAIVLYIQVTPWTWAWQHLTPQAAEPGNTPQSHQSPSSGTSRLPCTCGRRQQAANHTTPHHTTHHTTTQHHTTHHHCTALHCTAPHQNAAPQQQRLVRYIQVTERAWA
jgi:hypothetical protein